MKTLKTTALLFAIALQIPMSSFADARKTSVYTQLKMYLVDKTATLHRPRLGEGAPAIKIALIEKEGDRALKVDFPFKIAKGYRVATVEFKESANECVLIEQGAYISCESRKEHARIMIVPADHIFMMGVELGGDPAKVRSFEGLFE
jgi:hypothetical protein